MSRLDLFDKFLPFVEAVATKTYPLVKPLGWDRDDCIQHAGLTLWRLTDRSEPWQQPQESAKGYLGLTIRRAILRAARGRIMEPMNDEAAEKLAAPQTADDWVDDLIENADHGIAAYLRAMVRRDPGAIGAAVNSFRPAAASYVLAQLEGRKYRGGN